MNVSDFDYDLPADLIAQHPAARRELSRMLVLRQGSGGRQAALFQDLPGYLRPGDLLVLNDTRVIAARLFGHRDPSGGRVEAFLLEAVSPRRWHCLLRPGRRLRPGDRVAVEGAPGRAFVVAARREDGTFEIDFDDADVIDLLDQAGHVPLPPYIHRQASAADRERYQTVYAARPGAVAAPTAGLHFTPEILQRLRDLGVRTAAVTLHVGPGTFKPVQCERVEDHVMHEEAYELPPETAEAVRETRRCGGRVIAVGTTSVRTLETCAEPDSRTVLPGRGQTRIFLYPPRRPVVCDGLLTNFHLPRSTLLMLVSCFSTVEHVLAAYRWAVEERFRFYSYGDCMLLLPDEDADRRRP
ncbi:MAG: tRNA preQ1(34) S-adenosylmethionine ribosyltransferase-isomerase QueA [Lentisphaerae bacterium]|nr:tRNA preQ1(34) S-adenosylmethionine ribosyltransferase-isomerase QueA [Lentisphaerota bacterium]